MKTSKLHLQLVTTAILTAFLILAVGSLAVANELDEVKAAIYKHGAKWIAGETSVSKLSPAEKKNRVALIKPSVTGNEQVFSFTPSRSATTPPSCTTSSCDWSPSPDSTYTYVSPVKDQGNCGSCWAFATTAALESYVLRATQDSKANDLSEQVLISCGRAGSCGGGYVDLASDFIRSTGLPVESCYVYLAQNGTCRRACSDWKSPTSTYDIGSWTYIARTAPTVGAIKDAILKYGPLVTTMDVYTDFFYYDSGVYTYTTGMLEGGHAILIVGFDDGTQSFKVKNSWGTTWGEDGYFRIGYSQLTNLVHFGDYTIAYLPPCICTTSQPSPSSFPPQGGEGTVTVNSCDNTGCEWTAESNVSWITITSGSQGTGTATVEFTVAAKKGPKVRTGTITVAGQTYTISQ